MTEAKRQAKILLLQQNKTFADLAKDADLALATVHNVLAGHKSSKKSKRAITNALGAQIWPDVPVSERTIIFDHNVEAESPSVEMAIEFAKQFPKGSVKRTGRVVSFIKSFSVTRAEDSDKAS